MSADRCLLFYGVRVQLDREGSEQAESRRHPLIVRARAHGLQHYFGDFDAPRGMYYLFMGRNLAVIGFENLGEFSMSSIDLVQVSSEVSAKLTQAGITEEPRLYVQHEPDN